MTKYARITGCTVLTAVLAVGIARGQDSGSIVGWGEQVVVPESVLSDITAVAGGAYHSLGLKSDGSIVAWGDNGSGQWNVPAPNSDFVAVATALDHSLGLKGQRGDLNADGAIDLADYGTLASFLAGPQSLGPPGFAIGSLDGDADVDLADAAFFQNRFAAK